MTLGKGSAGTGAGTAGPDSGLYTSQTQTGLPNDGYGTIAAGTRPTDSDGDGMPDDWENATGSNPAVDDATTKASDGYALIEHYLSWLGALHASTPAGTTAAIDLSSFTAGFTAVSPSFTVTGAQNGTVALQGDGHTAKFQPVTGFRGVAAFSFTVTGSDGSAYTGQVGVLVTP